MAENKKSFLLYCDYIDMFKKLPDEIAGKLIKHIFKYTNDEDPQTDDLLLEIAFEPIKKQLKRDLKKYEGVIDEKSTGGKIGNLKRWHKDIYDEFKTNKISLEDALLKAKSRIQSDTDSKPSDTIAKITVKDTVTDTDNVTVADTVIDINKTTTSFPESGKPQLEILGSEDKKPVEEKKKKSSAKKRKEEISPDCKKYFQDYYLNQKGVDFYWTAADATALNQLIQKIRVISGNKPDIDVLQLFYVFIQKVKAADPWIYDNLSIRILNQKFNELIPKMKKVSADGTKQNIPDGYEEIMQGYLKTLNDE